MKRRTLLFLLPAALSPGPAAPETGEVNWVEPFGPAFAAGLARGDRIESLDGHPIQSVEDLGARLARGTPAESLRLAYSREGRSGVALVRLEKRLIPKVELRLGPRLPPNRNAQPVVTREGAGAVLSVAGSVRIIVVLSPACRDRGEIGGPEMKAGLVGGSSTAAGWRWYGLPRGGSFDLGAGTRVSTKLQTFAHWYTDPPAYSRPHRFTTSPLEARPGHPSAVLDLRVGTPTSLRPWLSRWEGWGVTCWDPELAEAFGVPVRWETRLHWGFSCKTLEASAPFPGGPGSVTVASQATRILAVRSGSAAAQAGLSPGDLITAINGVRIESPWTLFEMMVRSFPDQEINVDYIRGDDEARKASFRVGGDVREIPVEYPAQQRRARPPDERLADPDPRVRVGGPVEVWLNLFTLAPHDLRCEGRTAREEILPARGGGRPRIRYHLAGPVRVTAQPDLEFVSEGGLTATWNTSDEGYPQMMIVLEPRPAAPKVKKAP